MKPAIPPTFRFLQNLTGSAKRRLPGSLRLAKTAITLNPFDVEANYNFMVCARSLGKYAVAYQSFLMIQFVQMRYRITVINDETLAVWEQEFQILVAEDTDLENEFSRIEQNHRYAILDPF